MRTESDNAVISIARLTVIQPNQTQVQRDRVDSLCLAINQQCERIKRDAERASKRKARS